MNNHPIRMATLGLVVALGLAFGAGRSGAAPGVGEKAPDFTLSSIAGKPVQLAALTKKSPVALVVLRGFPGYQCPVCTAQVGELIAHAEDIQRANGQVLLVYPGPSDQLAAHAQEFVAGKKLPANFILALDPDFRFINLYGLRWNSPNETSHPSTFVVDSQGRVRFAMISKSHGGRARSTDIVGALSGIR